MNRLLVTITLAICIFVTALFPKALSSNEKAPNFSLPDLSGKTINLSDYKGKVIFLNFFATWCPPCREEMPSIQSLINKVKDKSSKDHVAVLTIAIDRRGKSAVSKFMNNNNYTFQVLLDPKNEVSRNYGVQFVPTSFIVDKNGSIIEKIIGPRDWASREILERFKKLE